MTRGIEERITWHDTHTPADFGMCAQHTWHSLGGDQGDPPAWGCSDANECVDKVKASGRYWTPTTWSGPPPRGAWVGYKYGNNGHAALSLGDGRIQTTDPSSQGSTPSSAPEPLDYPNKWGANGWTVWTDQYAGVRFQVGTIGPGDVYVSKLVKGTEDSDSVRRLQDTLNGIKLSGGSNLPVTGNYGDQTTHEVMLWQTQKATDKTIINGSEVTATQAQQLFAGTDHTVVDDTQGPPQPPQEPAGGVYWYSDKPPGELTFSGSYKRLDVPSWAPPFTGLTFAMLYLNVDGEGEYRVRLVREDPDDATAYQTIYNRGGDNGLLTHVWFEHGEAGRPLHWEMASMDGTTHTVTTRYAKFVALDVL